MQYSLGLVACKVQGALFQEAAGVGIAYDAGVVDQHVNGTPLITHEVCSRLATVCCSLVLY